MNEPRFFTPSLSLLPLLLLGAAPLVACGDAGGPPAPPTAQSESAVTSVPAVTWPLSVTPSSTDPALTSPADSSYVWGATSSRKNLLLVFFPGSLATPHDYLTFSQTAAGLGYDVLDLTYDNTAVIAEDCPDPLVHGSATTQQDQNVCFEAARGTVLFGKGATYGREPGETGSWQPPAPYQLLQPTVGTTMKTSVVNRIVAMLEYLGTTGGVDWGQYLTVDPARQYDGDELPLWSKILVAGHSQGGGHAALLAQRFAVHRSVSLSSPSDSWACTTSTCSGKCVEQDGDEMCAAAWVTSYSPVTKPTSMYALGNTRESYYGAQTEPNNWGLIGLPGPVYSVDGQSPPYAQSHELVTSISNVNCDQPGQTCTPLEEHDSTAVDSALQYVDGVPVLSPAWQTMITGDNAD